MTKPQVLLLGNIVHVKKEFHELANVADLIIPDKVPTREEFIEGLKGKYSKVTAIYSTFSGELAVGGVDEEIVDNFPPSLKFICHNGAGYDRIKVELLIPKKVELSNTPDAVANATADTGLYLILGALRNFNKLATSLRQGKWLGGTPEAHDPKDKVLGILGLGGIGSLIRDKAVPLGFSKILYHNRHQLPKDEEGVAEYVSFDELLAQSDVLSISIPLNPSTTHMINAEALAKCKDGVVIVNTARGAIVDEQALVDALESGKVSTVGLDVYEFEPKIHPKLLANENILLLPHVGTHTVESRKEMELTVVRNIRSALSTGHVIDLVPELRK